MNLYMNILWIIVILVLRRIRVYMKMVKIEKELINRKGKRRKLVTSPR